MRSLKYQRKGKIKEIRFARKKHKSAITQQYVADKMNKLFKDNGIDLKVDQKQIADLENDSTTLDLVRGLALANVLDTVMSEFVSEEVLQLGGFEVRLIYSHGADFDCYLRDKESHGRIVIFSTFPSSLYARLTPLGQEKNVEEREMEGARFNHFVNHKAATKEFYTLDSLLSFAFLPFSAFPLAEKINTLKDMVQLFSNSNYHHLHFFSRLPRFFADMEIITAENLIILATPVKQCYLEIRSPLICSKLSTPFLGKPENTTNTEESITLLRVLQEVLSTKGDQSLEVQIRDFYKRVPENLKPIVYENVKGVIER